MKLDTLDALTDAELQAVIDRSQELLKIRDDERKSHALEQARAWLASVGLSLRDLAGKGRSARHGKPAVYKGGHLYQHPTNKTLTWNAKGKKPQWLSKLEAAGMKPVELLPEGANDIIPPSLKKTG